MVTILSKITKLHCFQCFGIQISQEHKNRNHWYSIRKHVYTILGPLTAYAMIGWKHFRHFISYILTCNGIGYCGLINYVIKQYDWLSHEYSSSWYGLISRMAWARFFNKAEWELSSSLCSSSAQLEEILNKLNRLLRVEQSSYFTVTNWVQVVYIEKPGPKLFLSTKHYWQEHYTKETFLTCAYLRQIS